MPRTWSAVAGVAIALPWLWPWAPPPSPSVPGLLAAWSLTAVLWAVLAQAAPHGAEIGKPRTWVIWGSLLALAAWRMPVLDLAVLGGLAGSVLCVLVAARSAARAPTLFIQHLCWGLLTAALVSAGIAGLQYSGLLHQPVSLLGWLHASPNEEAYGQLRQRNQFGSLMSLGLATWLYLVQTGGSTRLRRGATWACLGVLTLGAVASTSRTGALTWIGLSLLALMWPIRGATPCATARVRQGAAVALLGFLMLCWLLPMLASSLNTVELPKVSAFERLVSQPEGLGVCESRVLLWHHVLELSWQRPWLGWGWGELDYAHATQPIQGQRFCGQLGHAHNFALHVIVEWGWPLALCGLGALGFWIKRHPPWQARSPMAVLGWSWVGVIGLHSLLEFPLWYGPFQMVLGLAIGLITQQRTPSQAPRIKTRSHMRSCAMVASWLICTLWAGWDYHRVSQVFQPPSLRSTACRTTPQACLEDVVWFHQARDFVLLRQSADALPPELARVLAKRVVHYAPEPWVLTWLATHPTEPTPPSNR